MQKAIWAFLTVVLFTGVLSVCPRQRPSVTTAKCTTDADCQNGYSCCPFVGGDYCSSTNAETCNLKGRTVWTGEWVLDDDQCTECSCLGYDQLVCTSETCSWQTPKTLNAISIAKCPIVQPRFANHTCNDSSDCKRDQQCCKYATENICVSKNKNVCTYGNLRLRTGDSINLANNCTFCECAGYENILCSDDECLWGDQEIKEKTPFCPMKRLPTEVIKCQYQRECSPEQNCCTFEDGKYCVSDRNNVCHLNGEKVMKLESVTMQDKCTVCQCRGYDRVLCENKCKKKKKEDKDNKKGDTDIL